MPSAIICASVRGSDSWQRSYLTISKRAACDRAFACCQRELRNSTGASDSAARVAGFDQPQASAPIVTPFSTARHIEVLAHAIQGRTLFVKTKELEFNLPVRSA